MVYTTNRSVTVDSECQWAEITGVNYGENNSLVELTNDSTTQTIDWLKVNFQEFDIIGGKWIKIY